MIVVGVLCQVTCDHVPQKHVQPWLIHLCPGMPCSGACSPPCMCLSWLRVLRLWCKTGTTMSQQHAARERPPSVNTGLPEPSSMQQPFTDQSLLRLSSKCGGPVIRALHRCPQGLNTSCEAFVHDHEACNMHPALL